MSGAYSGPGAGQHIVMPFFLSSMADGKWNCGAFMPALATGAKGFGKALTVVFCPKAGAAVSPASKRLR